MSFKDFLEEIMEKGGDKKEEAGELVLTDKQLGLLFEFQRLEKIHDEICDEVKLAKKKFWQTVEVEHNMIGEKLAIKQNNRVAYFKK